MSHLCGPMGRTCHSSRWGCIGGVLAWKLPSFNSIFKGYSRGIFELNLGYEPAQFDDINRQGNGNSQS